MGWTVAGIAHLVVEQSRSPVWNLALEEALLDSVARGWRPRVFRIWINARSIIIGRGLHPCEEVYCSKAQRLGIPIIRRSSGGGAVYHDEGNLNITLIERTNGRIPVDEAYRRGTSIITRALARLGIESWVENTSDTVVAGWKVSGSAAHIKHHAYLYHATLLVEADTETLHRVIKPRLDRVERGEVTPAKYRPRNLKDLAGVDKQTVISALLQEASSRWRLIPTGLIPGEASITQVIAGRLEVVPPHE